MSSNTQKHPRLLCGCSAPSQESAFASRTMGRGLFLNQLEYLPGDLGFPAWRSEFAF